MECHLLSWGGRSLSSCGRLRGTRLERVGVGLTSTHSLSSGTQLLERGWCGLVYPPLLWSCPGWYSSSTEYLLGVPGRGLSITNTMFEHKGVHQCTWHQDTLGRRSMIDFVVVSSDLRPYVLDTRVKRGAELSTDHHLVVSWIRWQRRKLDRPGRPKRVL
ncbi:hypothetical protein L3Q82_011558 [Scortum barcoo]|uniref:Uncharacterized protein n=1 Tax=Scortum barcoo TaxID=214431 RepID=A0ACB8W6C7_9TELE|nr:hypothetical protein L3Q82_011558 [Scortum barcoo]